jgi:hypothetical protein
MDVPPNKSRRFGARPARTRADEEYEGPHVPRGTVGVHDGNDIRRLLDDLPEQLLAPLQCLLGVGAAAPIGMPAQRPLDHRHQVAQVRLHDVVGGEGLETGKRDFLVECFRNQDEWHLELVVRAPSASAVRPPNPEMSAVADDQVKGLRVEAGEQRRARLDPTPTAAIPRILQRLDRQLGITGVVETTRMNSTCGASDLAVLSPLSGGAGRLSAGSDIMCFYAGWPWRARAGAGCRSSPLLCWGNSPCSTADRAIHVPLDSKCWLLSRAV